MPIAGATHVYEPTDAALGFEGSIVPLLLRLLVSCCAIEMLLQSYQSVAEVVVRRLRKVTN